MQLYFFVRSQPAAEKKVAQFRASCGQLPHCLNKIITNRYKKTAVVKNLRTAPSLFK